MPDAGEFPESNAASIDAWRTNAEFWDAAQGDEGNFLAARADLSADARTTRTTPGTST